MNMIELNKIQAIQVQLQHCIDTGDGMEATIGNFSFTIHKRGLPQPLCDKPGGRPFKRDFVHRGDWMRAREIFDSNITAWSRCRKANIEERKTIARLTKILKYLERLK